MFLCVPDRHENCLREGWTRIVHKELYYSCYQALFSWELAFFYCLSKFGSFSPRSLFLVCQLTSHNSFKLKLRIWCFQEIFYIYLYPGSWVLVSELLDAQHTEVLRNAPLIEFRNHKNMFSPSYREMGPTKFWGHAHVSFPQHNQCRKSIEEDHFRIYRQ